MVILACVCGKITFTTSEWGLRSPKAARDRHTPLANCIASAAPVAASMIANFSPPYRATQAGEVPMRPARGIRRRAGGCLLVLQAAGLLAATFERLPQEPTGGPIATLEARGFMAEAHAGQVRLTVSILHRCSPCPANWNRGVD